MAKLYDRPVVLCKIVLRACDISFFGKCGRTFRKDQEIDNMWSASREDVLRRFRHSNRVIPLRIVMPVSGLTFSILSKPLLVSVIKEAFVWALAVADRGE